MRFVFLRAAEIKEAAEMYINFLNEPDVAYAIADFIGYSTPNQKAYEMLDDEVKNDGISYLDDDYIEEKRLFSVIFQMRQIRKCRRFGLI